MAQQTSNSMLRSLCTAVLLLQWLHCGAATPLDAAACKALGFLSPACTDCDALASEVRDDALASECRSCCVADTDAAPSTFTSATLVACPFRIKGAQHIEEFVKKHAADYKTRGLSVKYTTGADFKLLLKGKGGAKEAVRIDSWKVQDIKDYLQQRLAA